MKTTLQIGDRVCFKEVPTMTGVVQIIEKNKYGVLWDITLNENEVDPPDNKTVPFYPRNHLAVVQEKAKRGNPNFFSRETNPAVIASNNHPVFPGLSCTKPVTVQIPEKVKAAITKPDGFGVDEELYQKIQFLVRKHALKTTNCKSWEEFKN